ncbi:Peptide-O-fucosyltransferase [Zostera marina]|uniref:O-fucosyltransferase family protein n=1 Tax=Zostera marina TaxID=29655 RepID=A0A0K9NVF2_ZOSMR|nr:Peptide-O-fucosyltransferase [Zostera marina]
MRLLHRRRKQGIWAVWRRLCPWCPVFIQRWPLRPKTKSLLVASAFFLFLLFFGLFTFFAPPFLIHDLQGHQFSTPRIPLFRKDILFPDHGRGMQQSFVVPIFQVSFGKHLWGSKNSKNFYGCSNSSSKFLKAEAIRRPNSFLVIATSGGLNQQRTGITDAVVAARILNATLVVPKLDSKSFWKDTSDFSEIFDVDWFISYLSKDVKIVKQLPDRGKHFTSPYTMRVPRKCTPKCYKNRVLPVLLKKHVVRLTKFDYRLANKLDNDLQRLRCRVNYHALKFTKPILEMGEKLIRRMKAKSRHFIALHLRFEADMLAFSGCYYGGGEKERSELGAIRKRWKTLHPANPEKELRHGKCPLTPEEVGLVLRALGFGSDVHIYVASGEFYGGEKTLAPLKALFPNYHSKETLATKEELSPFSMFSSRMAALDFIVCDGSNAFATNNNGNMAKILAGRRRYYGHKKTIRPNARKLYSLFLNRKNMTWNEFATKVRLYQKGFMGEPKEVRPGRGEFHENPSTCICEKKTHETNTVTGKDLTENEVSMDDDLKEIYMEEEDDWHDDEFSERQSYSNTTSLETDSDFLIQTEEPELEEMLSD